MLVSVRGARTSGAAPSFGMMPKLAIAALLVAALALGGGKLMGAQRSDTARVVRVVDGDTVVVRTGGHDERVRYIGVDTPESVKPGTPVQCFAKAASAENKRLVQGREGRPGGGPRGGGPPRGAPPPPYPPRARPFGPAPRGGG